LGGFFEEAAKQQAKEEALQQLVDKPLTSPASKQVTAPAKSSETTTLVNGASFPELVAMAFENKLVSSSQGVPTIDLNAFGYKALLSPGVLDRNSDYQNFESWRKWGGALSFGGKGESFDRNGDGIADPALETKELTDIVNWEVRYRFIGSRDRRDKTNVESLFNSDVTSRLDKIASRFSKLINSLKEDIAATESGEHPGCFERSKLESLVKRQDVAVQLSSFEESDQELQKALDDGAKIIDQKALWTIALGGLDRRKDFGPTKRTASLRFAKGIKGQDLTVNLDYSHNRSVNSTFPEQSWKLGLAYSALLFKGLAKDGVKLSLSAADELYSHVAAATHDSVVKANAKLDFPVMKGVKIPISLTWANHRDLLTTEHDVSGHIGFTIDLSEIKK